MKYIVTILCLYGLISQSFSQKNFFYLQSGQKIYLKQLDSVFIVKYKDAAPPKKVQFLNRSINRKSVLHEDSIKKQLMIKIAPEKIKEFKASEDIEYANKVFEYSDGVKQGLTNQVLLKLKTGYTRSMLLDSLKFYGITKVDSAAFDKKMLIVTLNKVSDYNSMDVSQALFQTGIVQYSEPNFQRFIKLATSDPYYNSQWAINNTGQSGGTPNVDMQVVNAWSITKGSPDIKIAVIDQGVDLTHPDLINNLLPGYDALGLGSNGGYQGNASHGTCVAGIIAAQENSIGVVGIAPNCKIIPIRVATEAGFGSDAQIADGIKHAWDDYHADIINCSWGGGSPSTTITNAINDAYSSGRGGKGTVILFSAGNNNTSVLYPANLWNVISVGAIDRCGIRSGRIDVIPTSCDPWCASCSPGSCYGAELDIVAPGTSIPTTDIQGSNGESSGDYTTSFGGTSAACPNAAGVVALMLSRNPGLLNSEVPAILESTTNKINNYSYTTNSNHPNGTWNNEVGYGLVNAYMATTSACTATVLDDNFWYYFNGPHQGQPAKVEGCKIIIPSGLTNAGVYGNYKLELKATDYTVINSEFTIPLGSELYIH